MDKQLLIEEKFKGIMEALGLDLTDDSLIDTPKRVAKMFVHELFYGLDEKNFPKITTVQNKMKYNEMLSVYKITANSVCEHHFLPIIGHAHISYIPKDKIIGLSKLNRIVDFYCKKPQIQERLTNEIHKKLCELLETEDVAVIVDGIHTCVKIRGIKDSDSSTRTTMLSGVYLNPEARAEFFNGIKQ